MSERIEFLQSSELFTGVPVALLRQIGGQFHEVRVCDGEVLFHEGEIGDAVYLVVSGTLALEVEGIRLLRRKRGECVGEFALIDDEPRSASAVARSDVTLLRWARDDFQDTLRGNPEVARGIFRVLTGKLRQDLERKVDMEIEKERWRQDLARAREIQMGMLPEPQLVLPALELAGYCTPATEVGGDYYDYLLHDGGRVSVVIGDVTGHGFYSSLFVAMAKSCLHTQSRFDYSPPRVMEALRYTLSLSIQRHLLMTCCYVLLDPTARCLSYANAGHPYPYHYRPDTGELGRLEALDPILGVLGVDAGEFSERRVEWLPGDVLVLYSDGITEARDASGEMFGHERLEACIREHAGQAPEALMERILDAVSRHSRGVPRADDLTLVVLRSPIA